LNEVADAVREVTVHGLDETVFGEVRFADTRYFAQQPPTQRVDAEARDEIVRVDGVAEGLADLPPVGGYVVVHEELVREREPGRQEDRGPDDRVETDDPLPDDVADGHVLGPPARGRGAEVVDERVEPHVDDLIGIAGHRDAPAPSARTRSRHADVADVGVEEREHLVATRRGNDAQRIGGDQPADVLGMTREPEVPVLFFDPLGWRVVLGARAFDELLTPVAVPTGVRRAVQVAGRRAGAPDRVDHRQVPRIGAGPDEVVVRHVERSRERGEQRRVARDEHGDVLARGRGRLRDLRCVLVGTGEEAHRPATAARVAGDRVGLHQFERVTEVRRRVDEGNGGGDVEQVHGVLLRAATATEDTLPA
jgi:hypothetical protein